MKNITVNIEFNIGDRVYYKLPDSPEGLVIDISYRYSTGIVFYEIQWDPQNNPTHCRGYELTTEKIII